MTQRYQEGVKGLTEIPKPNPKSVLADPFGQFLPSPVRVQFGILVKNQNPFGFGFWGKKLNNPIRLKK